MLRAVAFLSVVMACAALSAACHSGGSPAPTTTHTPADQSRLFFPAAGVDSYGLDLSQIDRDHLVELRALRQIDPCGFVGREVLAADNHPNFSYIHTAVREIEDGGVGDPTGFKPVGGDGCLVAFPSTQAGMLLRLVPGEPRANDSQFRPDVSHPGVTTRSSPCMFRASIPLTAMPGAPASMRDPRIEITPAQVSTGEQNLDDTPMCRLSETMADGVAAQVGRFGIPAYPDPRPPAARPLTSDPCAAAVELHAVRINWIDPRPEVQYPTTWRHPGVCNMQLSRVDSGPDSGFAVVRYGLAKWSETLLTSPNGKNAVRSERDGVTLLELDSDDEGAGCHSFVVAKTNSTVEPTDVGHAAGLSPVTPVVAVRLRTPHGASCADAAVQTALAAVRRAG